MSLNYSNYVEIVDSFIDQGLRELGHTAGQALEWAHYETNRVEVWRPDEYPLLIIALCRRALREGMGNDPSTYDTFLDDILPALSPHRLQAAMRTLSSGEMDKFEADASAVLGELAKFDPRFSR